MSHQKVEKRAEYSSIFRFPNAHKFVVRSGGLKVRDTSYVTWVAVGTRDGEAEGIGAKGTEGPGGIAGANVGGKHYLTKTFQGESSASPAFHQYRLVSHLTSPPTSRI